MDVNFVDVCFLSNSGFFNEIITIIDQELVLCGMVTMEPKQP